MSINNELLKYIVCTKCKADVEVSSGLLICKECKSEYSITNGIPNMLVEE